jgi:limonene-1,2-epoxide hydrolase
MAEREPEHPDAVRAFIEGFNDQDFDVFLAALDPRVELHTLKLGLITGHDEARRWATRQPGGLQQRLVLERTIEQGDRALALVRQQWLWEGTDEVAEENEIAMLFTIRGGKVVSWKPFADREDAFRDAGLTP